VSPVILVGLVVMWAVVLVPMWLRRHDEVEETRSVDRFNTAMHTLSRREVAADKQYVVMPHRTRAHEVHVSGASADGQRSPRRRPAAPRPAARRVTTAAGRRRRTLIGLLVATLLTLTAAVILGGLVAWTPQIVVDLCLLAFVAHLRHRARSAAAVRPVRRRPVAPVRPLPVDEPEHDDFEPVAVRGWVAVVEPEPLFDQTQPAEFEQPVAGAAYAEMAAGDARHDASYDDPAFEPVRTNDELFDQTAPIEPPVQPERVAAYQSSDRDFDIDIPLSDPVVEPAAVGEEIGARPWEPVPVPRPVYASKPVAPPRSPRVPVFEPLLPPIEAGPDDGPVDDLEEILDRRWAVND
jgi:hypothetical protein